jgi:hypothetical protein
VKTDAYYLGSDYALAAESGNFAYAMTLGGSEGPDSDFGIRAVAFAARETLRLVRTTELKPELFGTFAVGKAATMSAIFPLLHVQALDCRLSVAWIHGDKLTAYLYNDGLFLHINHKTVRAVHITQPEATPDFLAYTLDDVRKTSYLAQGGHKKVYDCILQGKNESGSDRLVRLLEPVVIQATVGVGDTVVLCSGGIGADWRNVPEPSFRVGPEGLRRILTLNDISVAAIAV